MPSTPLFGRIHHRLKLDHHKTRNDVSLSRKRRRNESWSISEEDHCFLSCGMIFVPSTSTFSCPEEYLLSFPKDLSKLICEAAARQKEVVIRNYSVLPLACSSIGQSSSTMEARSDETALFLEVHKDGIEILPSPHQASMSDYDRKEPRFGSCDADFWTLTQWWRKELVDRTIGRDCNQNESRQRITLMATVFSVSPIISLDPSHPFALVHVVDTNNDNISSVIVLEKTASLVWHSSILPGDTAIFRNLVPKAWAVPKLLQAEYPHLVDRIPSHVFVDSESTIVSPQNPSMAGSHCAPSIHGIVEHVQIITAPATTSPAHTMIEYIDLTISSLEESNTTVRDTGDMDDAPPRHPLARLYLSHFPISPSLQWSLRKGALVEASNVHVILDFCPANLISSKDNQPISMVYGCCLRSTVNILQCASEENSTLASSSVQSSSLDTQFSVQTRYFDEVSVSQISSLSIPHPWKAFAFSKITHSHLQFLYLEHVHQWATQHFRKSIPNISAAWIAERLFRRSIETKDTETTNEIGRRRRNPFAEFFHHPLPLQEEQRPPNAESQSGCALSMHERVTPARTAPPYLVGLNDIREASQKLIIERIQQRMTLTTNSDKIGSGWNGSIFVDPHQLLPSTKNAKRIQASSQDCCCSVFTGGLISELHSLLNDNAVASIRDEACDLPVHFSQQADGIVAIGHFVMGEIQKVAISCCCLGTLAKQANFNDIEERGSIHSRAVSLPSLRACDNQDLLGGCSIVRVGNSVFMVAMQILCSKCEAHENYQGSEGSMKLQPCISIGRCLDSSANIVNFSGHGETASGLLQRCRQCLKANSDGSHKCYQLSLTDLPNQESSVRFSNLQTLNLSISFAQCTARMMKLKEKLESLCPKGNMSDFQKTLASSFWAMGDSGRSCALTFGGSEEICSSSMCGNCFVQVLFPAAKVQKSASGYIYSRCFHTDMDSCIRKVEMLPYKGLSFSNLHPVFDFEARTGSWKGILNKRPLRRTNASMRNSVASIPGELILAESEDTPMASLGNLFESMCRHLCQQNDRNILPSHVRRLVNASVLGISFCQVQCCCTRCSCSLVDKGRRNGFNTGSAGDLKERTFWHLPLPGESNLPSNLEGETQFAIEMSNLRCPNGCSASAYGIKWECSAVLDDGTGQATVYADGEAAILLLGFTGSDVQCLKAGIWSCPDGRLVYKKTIPPSHILQQAVRHVVVKQKLTVLNETKKKQLIQQLPLSVRAEYLLQKLCRSSFRPRRPLDYLVRCKPLPRGISHLNHTTVDACATLDGKTAFHADACSYSLPQLKLELVDCSIPSFGENCWD